MQDEREIQFFQLANRDEAFRAAVFILAGDDAYRNCSISIVRSVFNSIGNDQYIFAARSDRIVGVVLWCEVSQETRDSLVRDCREPVMSEAGARGGAAVFVTAISSQVSGVVGRLWRRLVGLHAQREIIWFRHHRQGVERDRLGVIRNGRLVRNVGVRS